MSGKLRAAVSFHGLGWLGGKAQRALPTTRVGGQNRLGLRGLSYTATRSAKLP